jgi:hypothetical protein
MTLALILIVAASAAQTAQPSRFDLICDTHPAGVEQPTSHNIYHVDLERMAWCTDTCQKWA